VKRLYDRLAKILRGLPAHRREAFREHLGEQEQREQQKETDDDGGSTPKGDSG
jgi:hypothetical protein